MSRKEIRLTVILKEVGRGYENVYENVNLEFISILVENMLDKHYIKIRPPEHIRTS